LGVTDEKGRGQKTLTPEEKEEKNKRFARGVVSFQDRS